MTIHKIVLLTALILGAVGIQSTVGQIIKKINNNIKYSFDKLEEELEILKRNSKNNKNKTVDKKGLTFLLKENPTLLNDFQREHFNFELILKKKHFVGYLTRVIGYFELILFTGLTILLFRFADGDVSEKAKGFAILAGGWIALKIFGAYKQWSGAVLGRTYFYNFLIGSIINILLAAVLGFVFAIYIL